MVRYAALLLCLLSCVLLGHAGAGCFTASMMCFDTVKKEWHAVETVGGDAPSPRYVLFLQQFLADSCFVNVLL
jgi:hypothetical protein